MAAVTSAVDLQAMMGTKFLDREEKEEAVFIISVQKMHATDR